MINIDNYKEIVKDIDFKTLPISFLKGHQYIEKTTENYNNWDAYHVLNEKRFLQAKILKDGNLTAEEARNFEHLKKYFDSIGFNDNTVDSRYNKFLQLTSERREFRTRKYSEQEEIELDEIAKEVIDKIFKDEQKSEE